MLVNLEEYLAELKEQRLAIETQDNETEIAEKVAEFENKLRAEYAEKREISLNEKKIEIDVLERIVERETKKVVPEVEPVVDTAPVETTETSTAILFSETEPISVEDTSINNDFTDL